MEDSTARTLEPALMTGNDGPSRPDGASRPQAPGRNITASHGLRIQRSESGELRPEVGLPA